MSPNLILAFWMMAFFLIVVPGPDWAFVLASGARDNQVLPAVAGLMTGYALLAGVVAAGVGALVSGSPVVLTGLTVVGAVYLLYLGGTLLFTTGLHESARTSIAGKKVSWWGRSVRGVGVSSLNPKGLLFLFALLPQFTDPHGRWPIPVQIGALGLVFVLTCGVFYSAMGLSARAVLRSRPTTSRTISRVSGAAMVIIGVVLVVERLAIA